MATVAVTGVLASFDHVDGACDAIRELKGGGHKDLTVYTAAPNHEIEAAIGDPVSKVRWFTLVGAVLGCFSGFGTAIWMSRDWPLLVGGKPIAAIPAFVVIGFELTILFGSLFAVAGIVILSLVKSLKGRPYHPRFSDDRIGVFVPCGSDQALDVEGLFGRHGAVEVTRDA